MKLFIFVGLSIFLVCSCDAQDYEFPEDFKFGVATAAYQVEGAWNENGKGENIWDWITHTRDDYIADKSNGDIACDAYHKTAEDVQLLKDIKVDFYRFSISWARILPTGHINNVNPDGIRYYNELIDGLLANGITPLVTMYHWDLPTALHEIGGWPNKYLADIFVDYANLLFEQFGDRVQDWITFNEPYQVCEYAYGAGILAPAYSQQGIGGYLCGHTLLIAHGKTYRLYEEKYKDAQRGRIGISIQGVWFEPESELPEDQEAAEASLQFMFGWYAHPIIFGDYPAIMRQRIDQLSAEQNFRRSRLPTFTQSEIDIIKGSYDFLGLNHYTTRLCTPLGDRETTSPSVTEDSGAFWHQSEEWEVATSSWLSVVPWGLRKLLIWIKEEYGNPDVIITENGFSDNDGALTDCSRVSYYNSYLTELLSAIHEDNCTVTAYTAWSFMDNFEWIGGYTQKFGIYRVDFDDDARPRFPKMSAYVFKNVIESRRINTNYTPEGFETCPENDDDDGGSAETIIFSGVLKLSLFFVFVNLFLP